MNYVPAEPMVHEYKGRKADERQRLRIARMIGLGAIAAVALLVGFGAWSQSSRSADTVAVLEARKNAVPNVRTMTVVEDKAPRTIELPGSMAAFDYATLFARATGYISVRNVDIGSKVRKGDVLALIAAPDLDQQFDQAKAQLVQLQASVEQARANAELGRVTSARTSQLVVKGVSSAQQGDQDRLTFASETAALAVARANVVVQQAAVNRLAQLTDFEQITAPFDGVITSRLIDVGSLVTADANSGTPLFSIDRTDVLRVRVYVPQTAYFGIKDGDRATVTVPELPDRVFEGKVARLYGIVHFQVRRSNPVVLIPSQAVIFNKDGLSAAVVSNGKVELRKLELEADNGLNVEVRIGLRPGDRVILSPPANIVDGMRVQTS
jgi:RND family efflux transporter MFP subunit